MTFPSSLLSFPYFHFLLYFPILSFSCLLHLRLLYLQNHSREIFSTTTSSQPSNLVDLGLQSIFQSYKHLYTQNHSLCHFTFDMPMISDSPIYHISFQCCWTHLRHHSRQINPNIVKHLLQGLQLPAFSLIIPNHITMNVKSLNTFEKYLLCTSFPIT